MAQPGNEPRLLGRPARSLVAIPTELSLLPKILYLPSHILIRAARGHTGIFLKNPPIPFILYREVVSTND
jgi:hypothetical protein